MNWIRSWTYDRNPGASAVDIQKAASAAASTFSVVSMNVFLIPYYFVNKDNAQCKDQLNRAEGIGKLIDAVDPDFVCLQEMWGSSSWAVEKPLKQRFHLNPGCGSFGFTSMDTMWQFGTSRGGLWSAYHKSAAANSAVEKLCASRSFTYSYSATKSRKGVMISRYLMKGGAYLIIVNTHVDPTNANQAQEKQFAELVTLLRQLMRDPGFSGQPKNAPADWSNTALLILGDMNCQPHTPLGKKMFGAFGYGQTDDSPFVARDLYAEYCLSAGRVPEPTYDGKVNSCVTYKGQTERLDLQFGVDRFDGARLRKLLPVDGEVITQPAGKELSDHWAVRLRLKVV